MTAIPNFPEDLLDLHHHWHSPAAHPDAGPGRVHAAGTPGGGLEFLTFHRNFVAMFHAWYDNEVFTAAPFDDAGLKALLVAPWHTVPAELRRTEFGWNAFAGDAARLDSGTPDFATADDLGTFIELGIHNNFLHGAASEAYGEPDLRTFHSPYLTEFYGIHGLVDYWWSQWQRRHKRWGKEIIKEVLKELVLEVDLKELKDLAIVQGPLKRISDGKAAALEVLGDPAIEGDPAVLQALEQRLTRLEREAFPGTAFISAERRPDVCRISPRPLDHEA